MKYLVMECRSAYAVVLGEDGAFRKVANLRYEVGQTVTDVVPLNLPETARRSHPDHRRWIAVAAAFAACLVLMLTVVLAAGRMPCASVYLTINPEIRIDVSRSDTVVGLEGINADGTALLEGYDHRKKDLDTVMDELVDRAIDMGYLHEGGTITLSLNGDDQWIVSHETHLNEHLNEHLTDKITVTIDVAQGQPTAPAQAVTRPGEPDCDEPDDDDDDRDDDDDDDEHDDDDDDDEHDDDDCEHDDDREDGEDD